MPGTHQTPNRLAHEKSPYLLQHAYNPVDWFPWGQAAFRKAQKEDKPLFMSIGYSTCHWCHVMEQESFENVQIADLLNHNFVCIKVDREERPDIDAVYMKVCQAMTGTGGWPLTIMMSPDQKPFFAATYLPPSSRGGRAGMLELLPEIAQQWRDNRTEIDAVGEKVRIFLQQPQEEPTERLVPGKELLGRAVSQFRGSFDTIYGGFGAAPKFPAPHNLLFLLRHAVLEGDQSGRKMVEKTLSQMYRGGIFDHVGGGFSRYSTDRKWEIPHFEKMLYDNALLTMAYLEAFQLTRKPLWKFVVRRTLEYVLEEMTHPQGGFYCAQDADAGGVEGGYYVFSPEEINHVLGKDTAALFYGWFGITEKGNFEGKNIPHLLENAYWDGQNPRMEEACRELYAYRLQRASLHKDDKILTAWNSLMIAAFARAGFLLHEPRYQRAAEQAHAFLSKNLMHGGRLSVRWRDGEAAHDGQLDDYAFYAFALLTLYETTFQSEYLQECTQIVDRMLQLFFDAANGGFYFYSAESETLIDRPKETYDGAMPSGNSVAAVVLGRLARLTGAVKWQEASDMQLHFLTARIKAYPMGSGFALLALQQALYPSEELLCVTAENKSTPAFCEFLSGLYRPNLTVVLKTPKNAQDLERVAPFTKEYPIPASGAAFYLCRDHACMQPVYDIDSLRKLIEELHPGKFLV